MPRWLHSFRQEWHAASKAGPIGLAQVVNAPGATPETRTFVSGLHALKRLGRPEELARAARHLASEDSSFMTGATPRFDGGVSSNRT